MVKEARRLLSEVGELPLPGRLMTQQKEHFEQKMYVAGIKFLYAEHGEAMSLMRAIKKALDPDNIMNPGKILGPIN